MLTAYAICLMSVAASVNVGRDVQNYPSDIRDVVTADSGEARMERDRVWPSELRDPIRVRSVVEMVGVTTLIRADRDQERVLVGVRDERASVASDAGAIVWSASDAEQWSSTRGARQDVERRNNSVVEDVVRSSVQAWVVSGEGATGAPISSRRVVSGGSN